MNSPTANVLASLPEAAQVKDMLGMLFDGLAVGPGATLDISAKSGSYFAVYVADDGAPAALCACDLAFAANSASALSMLPPNVAKDAAKSKQLTEVMLANLREIMNIFTRLLIREGTAHLRLQEVCQFPALPPSAAAIIGAAKGRVDFEITIGRYGAGKLAVMSL
jgi:hypothetical protein